MRILIRHVNQFRHLNRVAVHHVVESIWDVQSAFDQADRDGFETVVLYASDHRTADWLASEAAEIYPDAVIDVSLRHLVLVA